MITRTYSLPHGYTVEFRHSDSIPLDARWSPDVPRIHKPRQRHKFMEAYRAVRRAFLNEVTATIGGNVLVVDTDEHMTCETILAPTRH